MKLYLDIDGVFNPWRSNGPHKHWSDYRKIEVRLDKPGWLKSPYRLWISADQTAALLAVTRRHDIEIVWATSWIEQRAYEALLPHIGFPAGLREIDLEAGLVRKLSGVYAVEGECGKLVGVRQDAGEDGPIIWIDDCIGEGDRAWAEARRGKSLLIVPHPSVGLTRAHLEQIEQFALDDPYGSC